MPTIRLPPAEDLRELGWRQRVGQSPRRFCGGAALAWRPVGRHARPDLWVRCDAMAMEQRISLVTLGVKDLARARQFYEALGWSGGHQPDDEVCFFQAGGMVFGLWTALGGHGAPGIELAHNVRSPEEVSAVLAEAERAGGTIVRPARSRRLGRHNRSFRRPRGLRVGGCPQSELDGPRRRHDPHLARDSPPSGAADATVGPTMPGTYPLRREPGSAPLRQASRVAIPDASGAAHPERHRRQRRV